MTAYHGTRDDRLITRVPPELGGWARQQAASRFTTVSSLIALLLAEERQRQQEQRVKPEESVA